MHINLQLYAWVWGAITSAFGESSIDVFSDMQPIIIWIKIFYLFYNPDIYAVYGKSGKDSFILSKSLV